MGYVLNPVDVMHFGTGKSSTAIDSHIIPTYSTPSIFTLAGGFRNIIFEKRNIDLEYVIEYVRKNYNNDEQLNALINNLQIIGPFIWKNGEILFSTPNDFFIVKDETDEDIVPCEWLKVKKLNIKFDENFNLDYIPWFYKRFRVDSANGWFINIEGLKKYLLLEKINKNYIVKFEDIFEKSVRPGIKINKEKRKAEEHHLYFEEYVSFKNDNFSFYVELNDDIENEIGNQNIIFLGGERKFMNGYRINYSIKDELYKIKEQIKKEVLKTGIFKLIFLTPAVFNSGWKMNIKGAEILACIIDRPIMIGGFDMARMIPKPGRKFITPGSVYIVKVQKDNLEEIFERLYFNDSLTDDFKDLGFGKTIIGLTNLKEDIYD